MNDPSPAPDEGVASRRIEIMRVAPGHTESAVIDEVVVEEPLEIRVRGQGVAVTMRTPGHDEELAAGFLLTEGVIRRFEDVLAIHPCEQGEAAEHGNVLNVFLSPKVEFDFARLTRHVFASSSCGLCGKATIESVQQQFPPVASGLKVPATVLSALPEKLARWQTVFARTGGLHAAAVFDTAGGLVVVREDVGRHNAVDKVIGHGLLERRPPFDAHILLVSGRASFEIMQKALAARIPVVASVSAPSSLAVEFARRSGQTLAGFVRDDRMNLYAHPERVTGGDEITG